MLFFLFGFGNIFFIGFMIGFGAYVKGYITRFWVDRFYNWPYLFTAILIILFLFYYLPKKIKIWKNMWILNWSFLIIALLISQLIWKPINFFYQQLASSLVAEKSIASEIADAYTSGKVLLPEDRPYVTYYLAHDYGIQGRNMVGQMFDPFFYFPNQEDLFKYWDKDRKTVIEWLKDNNITLLVLKVMKPSYVGLIAREPQYFTLLPSEGVTLYRVEIN